MPEKFSPEGGVERKSTDANFELAQKRFNELQTKLKSKVEFGPAAVGIELIEFDPSDLVTLNIPQGDIDKAMAYAEENMEYTRRINQGGEKLALTRYIGRYIRRDWPNYKEIYPNG